MPTPSIAFPSASSGGTPIPIGATATTLHVTPGTAGLKSEVYLWLSSIDTTSATNVTVTIDSVVWSVLVISPLAGPYLVIPGLRLGASKTVTATAAVAGRVVAILNVNEVVP